MRSLILTVAILLGACHGSKDDALHDNAQQPVVNQTIPAAPPANANGPA